MNELDLVSGCKLGDNNVRRCLYERYSQKMLAICYRYTGDRQVAEDLLHDGFIRIFESIGKFEHRGDGTLKAWMNRIFSNISLEYLRKTSLMGFIPLDEQEPEIVEENDFIDIPSEVLMNFIANLPAGYRTVLNLYIFEDKSHKEIAELLRINEVTSRSQFARAKVLLAKKVREYLETH
jgi:RNA polymerase sigma-70 factor (ECF subfamily)